MKKIERNTKPNMKKAAIEQIFIWMVLFALFVTIFFMVINYSQIVRVKDTMDTLAEYASSMIAKNGVNVPLDDNLNSIKLRLMSNISFDSATDCNAPVDDDSHQVIINVETTNNEYKFYDGKLTAKKISYNQLSSNRIECTISITLNN